MYDLNDLIDPALHLELNDAAAINDSGQIVANDGSSSTGYLLTPSLRATKSRSRVR